LLGPLTDQNIESELSYAYLHALVTTAGGNCQVSNRHADDRGIDALINLYGPFESGGLLQEVSINIQLKATSQPLSESRADFYSFWLDGKDRYNALTRQVYTVPRYLVVLSLPKLKEDWISCTPEELILRRAAYWVSLRGATEITEGTGKTVYIPTSQQLTPESLLRIGSRLADQQFDFYREGA
jgi:hypothetical protein